MKVSLSTTSSVVGDAVVGTDTLISVERVRGTSFADSFTVTDTFSGNNGNGAEFEGNGGNDTYVGIGNTRIGFSQALNGVTVNLLAGTAQSIAGGDAAGVGVDSFAGVVGPNSINAINGVRGSSFADTISAAGARGAFDFIGAGGNDTLIGTTEGINNFDNNEARYDIGTNNPNAISVVLDTVSTVSDVGGTAFGTDTLINVERVRGTQFNDTFVATTNFSAQYGIQNFFEGMDGDDTITGNGATFVQYSNALAAVTVNLATGTGQSTAGGDAAGVGVDTFVSGVRGVTGSAFNDTLIGSNSADAENFNGGSGDDTIDGGGGVLDRLNYRPSAAGINANLTTGVVLDGNGGTDTVSNIEGVAGSEHNDIIIGKDGVANRLQGNSGDDQITGGDGNDFLVGDDRGPVGGLYAGAFGSNGTAFDSGNDILDGGAGADQMWGGVGNDTYVVDDAGDVVTELASEGTDLVQTTLASYSLGADVENLTFTDDGTHLAFGNALANVFTGGDGEDTFVGHVDIFESVADTYNGGDGNDTFHGEFSDIIDGGAGTDFLFQINANAWNIDLGATSIEWMFAGFGNDTIDAATQTAGVTVFASGGGDTVTGSAFDDFLWAGAGDDTVVGGDGNDLLFGDVGADSLSGGDGSDTFYADVADTLISGGNGVDNLFWTENAVGANIDMAANSLEWALTQGGNDTLNGAAGSANLVVFAGAGTDAITGGSGADFLWGEGGDDTIAGNSGNDVLVGGTGSDTLTGGIGTDNLYGNSGGGADSALDTFVFTTGWGTDFVYDFENGTDLFDMTELGIDFTDLTVTTVGAHARVAFGGNQFIVVNSAGLIDSGDFLF